MRHGTSAVLLALIALGSSAACGDDALDPNPTRPTTEVDAAPPPLADGGTEPGRIPFEPVGPNVYVPKVKNLLTGLAATDDEVKAVTADPNALRGLIDKWMELPSFRVRMLDFMRNAFQQNQVSLNELNLSMGTNLILNNTYTPRLMRNLMDSFGLTVWKLLDEKRPFTEAFTTRRYMMTTAMMSLIAYFDEIGLDDARRNSGRLQARAPLTELTLDSALTTSPDDSLDPSKPTFMKFAFTGTQPAGCATTAQTFSSTGAGSGNFYTRLFQLLMGRVQFNPCGTPNPPNAQVTPMFREADWDDWHMVEVRVNPTAPGTTPNFWSLAQLRTATQMTLHTDRLGYMGTLAFATNWGTNLTNEARVTANQALIVGIGRSILGENAVVTFPVDATDADHSANPACQGCHSQLDPYKQFFRQSWSVYYGDQRDPLVANAPAGFAIDGVSKTGKGVSSVAEILSQHPRMPLAWVNKLQFWANSTPALESDPEVMRIAKAFADSSYDFKTLVRETFSSPLVTWAAETETTKTNGVIISIARRDQFCASLSNRLGLNDFCGMLSVRPDATQRTVAQRALLLPTDGYYRSFELPSLPTNPDLFFRQSTEAICRLAADQVIDVRAPATSKYTSADAPAAIDDFVANVMGLVASDPRAAGAKQILNDNFEKSKASGANATDSLKGTFVLACLAPSSVVVGF